VSGQFNARSESEEHPHMVLEVQGPDCSECPNKHRGTLEPFFDLNIGIAASEEW